MTSKALSIAALAASAILAGCDYCPRPGVFESTPQFYYPGTPAYPIPKATECGIEARHGVHGKPVGTGHQGGLDFGIPGSSASL